MFVQTIIENLHFKLQLTAESQSQVIMEIFPIFYSAKHNNDICFRVNFTGKYNPIKSYEIRMLSLDFYIHDPF